MFANMVNSMTHWFAVHDDGPTQRQRFTNPMCWLIKETGTQRSNYTTLQSQKAVMFTQLKSKQLPSFVFARQQTQRYWVRIPVSSNVCHRSCAYTVLQTVQRPGMCSAVYGSVHYKEPLKTFDKSGACSRLRVSFCRDIAAMIVQKRKWHNIHHSPYHSRGETTLAIGRVVCDRFENSITSRHRHRPIGMWICGPYYVYINIQ